jgi:hypothetical protein
MATLYASDGLYHDVDVDQLPISDDLITKVQDEVGQTANIWIELSGEEVEVEDQAVIDAAVELGADFSTDEVAQLLNAFCRHARGMGVEENVGTHLWELLDFKARRMLRMLDPVEALAVVEEDSDAG